MSLRGRFILVALGAVLPLAALGLVFTLRATAAGEALLTAQLDAQLLAATADANARWIQQQSDLLLLGENEAARQALTAPRPASGAETVPAFVRSTFATMPMVEEVTVRDLTGAVRWRLVAGATAGFGAASPGAEIATNPTITVQLPLTDQTDGTIMGSMEAKVQAIALLPQIAVIDSRTGPMLAAVLPGGRMVAPPGADPLIFTTARSMLGGQQWRSIRRRVTGPGVDLVVAGALDPYVAPSRRIARDGALGLILAAIVLTAMVIAATRRMTGGLDRLVTAAEAVTAGDMDQRIAFPGHDDIGRVATAFNTMTDSLHRNAQALARREALAAVGEFAAELAHEIRNPLTSMRLDLERLSELGSIRDAERAILERTLRQLARLDRAVSGALRVARGATAAPQVVVLQDVLEAASQSAAGEFEHHHAALTMDPVARDPVVLEGDANALEQLFVNLLVNAAQAVGTGGAAKVSIAEVDGAARVTIAGNGPGLTPEQVERAQNPFYSTKPNGTGLGLAIARRIAAAHGGTVRLDSNPGEGTSVQVELPVLAAAATDEGGSSIR